MKTVHEELINCPFCNTINNVYEAVKSLNRFPDKLSAGKNCEACLTEFTMVITMCQGAQVLEKLIMEKQTNKTNGISL
jgi:hypothetical protein